jgi:DNA primase
MNFPPSFLDELRFRVPLAQVVGRKVKLTRAGREWKGCCPFHTEKTPSFYINEEKQFYHCFGCGAHGDVIRFLTDNEGLSFPEAVKQLAAEAGMEVPEETPEARAQAERAASLYDVMDRAAAWFEEQLQGLSGSGARAYIEKRGLIPATVKRFRLGFAPDNRTALKAALTASGITVEQLVEAGLLIKVEDKDPYDRFRGRLMFPIRDPKGRVIAFGGRVLDGGEPKYLNSPDTPLFDKGRTLYNLDQAGPLARKSGEAHIVEGYMDVIALAQVGLETAVAPLGTALTEDQMKLLWRVSPEPLVCLDGDTAGQRAALRAANRALPVLVPGRSLRFLTLPQGDDPDTLVRAKGLSAFKALAGNAETLIDLLWRSEVSGQDHSTPERRAALHQRLL